MGLVFDCAAQANAQQARLKLQAARGSGIPLRAFRTDLQPITILRMEFVAGRRSHTPYQSSDDFAGQCRASGSASPIKQFAAYQHAADFVGAGADCVELGIAQQAAGVVFVDVAVAAQRLDGFQGDLHAGF